MDAIDFNIIQALQEDGRLSNVELAERINLSPSPCLRRVKRLEQDGIITSYRANLNREKAGLPMTIFVDVTLDNNKDHASTEFENAVLEKAYVISCFLVSGVADYRLEIVTKDLKGYEEALKQTQSLPHVKSINSNFAIRAVKTAASLPLVYDA
jgi:Lrp/AsnC family leucine-responsive transcriptional regulator